METLNTLYPVATKALIETDMDKESKKPEYTPLYIKENDSFSYAVCEALDIIIRKSLNSASDMKFKKLMGLPNVDYSIFWSALLEAQPQKFFERLLRNYLFKIKVHHLNEMNSGYFAGTLVNLILENCNTNDYMKKYAPDIHKTCLTMFQFLCKTLIHSHAWMNRKHIKVYLQSHIVDDPIGAGRILLVNTLRNIIWNDTENEFSIIADVGDTCWHTLILWFYEKKTNNMYQHVFYSILEKVFTVGTEKILITILFKLNLLANMVKIYSEICINNVFLKEKHIDSVVYYLKNIMKLVRKVSKEKAKFPKLYEQLTASQSWKDLKEKIKFDNNLGATKMGDTHGSKRWAQDSQVSTRDRKNPSQERRRGSELSPNIGNLGAEKKKTLIEKQKKA
jgi:hypothetical protein